MSEKPPDTNDVETRINIPVTKNQKIYLYILRYTSNEDKFKIKAYFNNDFKYTFNRLEAIDEKATRSPYIYRADVDLILDNQNRLCFNGNNILIPVQYYRLRLSRKIFNTDTTFRDYNDEKDRYMNSYTTSHYFLFDVDFMRNIVDGPPGKKKTIF